jgi:hypothetical protein
MLLLLPLLPLHMHAVHVPLLWPTACCCHCRLLVPLLCGELRCLLLQVGSSSVDPACYPPAHLPHASCQRVCLLLQTQTGCSCRRLWLLLLLLGTASLLLLLRLSPSSFLLLLQLQL